MYLKFNLFNKTFLFRVYDHYLLDDAVVGVNSDVGNGKHALFIDFDDLLTYSQLVREIKRLQSKFGLGPAEIYESSFEKYVVFFFYERLDYFSALKIIYDANCCKNFKKWRMLRDEMTIRLTPKKGYKPLVFLAEIKSKNKKLLAPENKKLMDFVHKSLGVEK